MPKTDKVRAAIGFSLGYKKSILGKVKDDSIVMGMKLRNYCDENLQCWCDMKATSLGEPVQIPGFYAGEHSFDLQPFAKGSGWIKLSRYVDISKLRDSQTDENRKEVLRFVVNFSYEVWNKAGSKVNNVTLLMFYDFKKNKLVSDY